MKLVIEGSVTGSLLMLSGLVLLAAAYRQNDEVFDQTSYFLTLLGIGFAIAAIWCGFKGEA